MIRSLHGAVSQLSYLPRTLRLVWAAAPGWTMAWLILLVVQGLLPAATVSLLRSLVDTLVGAIDRGSPELLQTVIVRGLLMAALFLIAELLQTAGDWIRSVQAEHVQDHISGLIHSKSIDIDLAFYETPEFYDHLHRARDDAGSRSLALLESIGGLTQNGVTLVAIAALLLPYAAWLPVVLFVSSLPALVVLLQFKWRYHQWWEESTPERRWTWYYDWMLIDSQSASELRLLGLGPHFKTAFQALRRRLRTEHLSLLKGQSLAQLFASTVGLVIAGTAMAWMVWRALRGLATLGDLVLLYQAFSRGQSLLRSLLANVGQVYSNSLFLSNLFAFLDLHPRIVDPPDPVSATIYSGVVFRDISFRYPGSERVALQNFNLAIPAGKTVAIVGTNGAGKSTLVKLLCRLYDPEAGCIELDGVDLRKLSLESLRRTISVLFQSPVAYQATAGQNIGLGDLSTEANGRQIEIASRAAGAHEVIERLAEGYDTLLGKAFVNGTDLSGGEWQRIALARAFLRQSPFVILDEPTSFMDSWAEAEWLDRFRSLVDGRTALIITHRFTTAMRADIIHVMDQGMLIESGSHNELLALGGRYAQSWATQMQAGWHETTAMEAFMTTRAVESTW
jgi:ATP-binding cassette, subfamily B, bacterial